MTFVSGPSVGDLACPHAPPPKPHGPHIPEPLGGTDMPATDLLGTMAHPVIREQPIIDSAKIPEFALRDGSAFRPRRIAVWGDSHAAAGPFMPTVQDIIRANGVSIGSHFLPPTMGRANVRLPTLHAYCIGHGWSSDIAFLSPAVVQTGPALMNRVAQAGPESYLWLDLRSAEREATVRQIQIVYRAPQGAELDVSVNDGPQQRIQLKPSSDSATLMIRGDALISTIKLDVAQGSVVLHGFLLDYDQPPLVTFDVFGLPSSTARGWANADPAYLARALSGTDYDAVILEYGTNEGNDLRFDPRVYASDLAAALTNMRSVFPHASCVLVGPPDRGVLMRRQGGSLDLLTFSRIHQQITATQAEVGARFGCALWNWQDLMGGPGGSYGWAHHVPPLAGADLTHLTGAGYKRSGEALARSLGWGTPGELPFPP